MKEDKYIELFEDGELFNYITQLESNWKELQKWLKVNIKYAHWLENSKYYENVLNKMEELESGNNE